jgi:hypothetical protein
VQVRSVYVRTVLTSLLVTFCYALCVIFFLCSDVMFHVPIVSEGKRFPVCVEPREVLMLKKSVLVLDTVRLDDCFLYVPSTFGYF